MNTEIQPTPEPDTGGEALVTPALFFDHEFMKALANFWSADDGDFPGEQWDFVALVTRMLAEARAEAWRECFHAYFHTDEQAPKNPYGAPESDCGLCNLTARTAPLQDAEEVGEC